MSVICILKTLSNYESVMSDDWLMKVGYNHSNDDDESCFRSWVDDGDWR